ncbi:MAG: hypothetical protein KC713_02875 [Candidatus Omnitrophica bacterium]|nr:hypothetical protein [Candidatus Omnitrophota bacterium]
MSKEQKTPLAKKKILITCGPTWIPIDGTRIMSNISTGRLGQLLAKDFSNAGGAVTLLEGPVHLPIITNSKNITILKFTYYDELLESFKKLLAKRFDIVLHAAAVSDYKLKKPFKGKLQSNIENLNLELTPTKKIIHLVKKSSPKTYLVGFKLANNITHLTAKKRSKYLFDKAQCDLVVANSTNSGLGYTGYVLNRRNELLAHETSREAISQSLLRIITEEII